MIICDSTRKIKFIRKQRKLIPNAGAKEPGIGHTSIRYGLIVQKIINIHPHKGGGLEITPKRG